MISTKQPWVVAGLVAGLLGSAMADITYAGCTVYQHRDYGGAYWGLNGNEHLVMGACSEDVASTNGSYWYCRPDWNDHISSYRVSSNCRIILWSDVNGYDRPAGVRFSRDFGISVRYVGDRWNDQASYADCYCR